MSSENLSLKGSMFPITVMDLPSHDLSTLRAALAATVQASPDFFADAPLIVDCSQVDSAEIDFLRLKSLVSEAGMFLVGVSGIGQEQISGAQAVGLPLFNQIGKKRTLETKPTAKVQSELTSSTDNTAATQLDAPKVETSENRQEPTVDVAPEMASNHSPNAEQTYAEPLLVNGIVRSGQRLYAEGRDMVVFGNVSPGAEIIADGNIQIYGRLRGRALAGAKGNQQAFICASSVQAELISIAGYYKVLEDDKAYHDIGVIKVTLDQTSLKFTPLDQA